MQDDLNRRYILKVSDFMDDIFDQLRNYIKGDEKEETNIERMYYLANRFTTYLESRIDDVDKSKKIKYNARQVQQHADRREKNKTNDEEIDFLIECAKYEHDDLEYIDD